MSVFLTNGVTVLQFRDGDFNIPLVPPLRRPQVILPSSVGLSRVHEISSAQSRVIEAEVLLFRADQGIYSGADSLMAFYENNDNTGVNGLEKTFMLTDADGVTYQVRFADDLGGGMQELKKDSIFRGSFSLIEETTLPTYEATAQGWWAAYDMDDNGGYLSAWSTTDPVGAAAGTDWDDKSGNGRDATESTNRPLWTTSRINGRPAIVFDGSNDLLASNTIATAVFDETSDQAWSAYAVIKAGATSAIDTVIACGATSTDDRLDFIRLNGTANYEAYIDDNISAPETEAGGTPDQNAHIVVMTSSGQDGLLFVDGLAVTLTGSLGTGQLDFDTFHIGAVNAHGAGSNYFLGDIGEIIIFNTQHTTLQRRRQEFRLSDMWGIDLTR